MQRTPCCLCSDVGILDSFGQQSISCMPLLSWAHAGACCTYHIDRGFSHSSVYGINVNSLQATITKERISRIGQPSRKRDPERVNRPSCRWPFRWRRGVSLRLLVPDQKNPSHRCGKKNCPHLCKFQLRELYDKNFWVFNKMIQLCSIRIFWTEGSLERCDMT